MSGAAATLRYDRGSLVVEGLPLAAGAAPGWLTWDARIGAHRGLALHYRALVSHLTHAGVPFHDGARRFGTLVPGAEGGPPPYPHQQEALAAWAQVKRGSVELPTGAGKTRLALMALRLVARDTLVLVPTLELVAQWCAVIARETGLVAGAIGGGSFELRPVTVCTYASALRHAETFGDRFGLVVFDECHHLAGAGYASIAELLIAPYRLGLSATLARPDGRHAVLDRLIGPVCYRKPVGELSGRYLAPYDTQVLYAELTPAEREAYTADRETYRGFARGLGIPLGGPRDWQRFVFAAYRSAEGRAALAAYWRQRRAAFAAEAKFALCAALLERHRGRRMLVFTEDNRTACEVSRRFLLPLITHQTGMAERRAILARFREGRWPMLVSSKVLNEGVDVPAASVAIILSGNASVREHVQRLGRILRREGDKTALLYELLTRETAEEHTSRRRRQHDAYR